MAASMASPRGRSIRETVLETVAAYHNQQRARRKLRKSLTYAGELSSAGRRGARGGGGGGASSSSSASVSSLCGPEDDDEPFWEEEEGTVELVQLGANRAKNVLILMSDTGGGHRASAEAIKDAFRIEFGDEYRVRPLSPCLGLPLRSPPYSTLLITYPSVA
jgi:1,2-diacylglycerol 3-beta-galactosyltransferase